MEQLFYQKNPSATRRMSHDALETELQILVKNLETYTKESEKATAMCCDLLKVSIFTYSFREK